MWIQTGVTVRKQLSWVVTSVTLTFDLWPWPFAWTLLWSLAITPEKFMMIRWWEHSQKGVTDGRTDGRTDRRTENTICRAAWSQLKIVVKEDYCRYRMGTDPEAFCQWNGTVLPVQFLFWFFASTMYLLHKWHHQYQENWHWTKSTTICQGVLTKWHIYLYHLKTSVLYIRTGWCPRAVAFSMDFRYPNFDYSVLSRLYPQRQRCPHDNSS